MKRLFLHEHHAALDARFFRQGSWEIVRRYRSHLGEHRAVREKVGICDLSFRTKLEIDGKNRNTLINSLITKDIQKLSDNDGVYAAFLARSGKIISDAYVNRQADIVLLDLPAETREIMKEYLRLPVKQARCQLVDSTLKYCMLTVQGRLADRLMSAYTSGKSDNLKENELLEFEPGRMALFVVRRTRTGEPGYDVYGRRMHSKKIWDELMDTGKGFSLRPFGFEALESLRIEAGIPRYGMDFTSDDYLHELHTAKDMIDFDKADFIGHETVARVQYQGEPARRLVGLEVMRLPGAEDQVYADRAMAGVVKSSVKSPTLGRNIAIAALAKEFIGIGTILEVIIKGRKYGAEVVPLPFYVSKELTL